MDVKMYKYPHESVLYQLFPKYIGKYDLLKKDLEGLVEKKCDNHAHVWKTTKVHWDMDAKDIKCKVCGEERHVEIDSHLGGEVI